MKKLLFTVLAALTLSGAMAQEAFPDIPAGHWAGEAVSRIADLGIVIGFPDGTFRGNESFTRYQAALVVSRLLDVIQQNMDAMRAMSDADIASLRNALQELASDVAAQGVRLSAVEGQVAALSDDVASNSMRLDALENMDMSGLDPAVLQDLLNQIAAARTAADTAAAQAAAAEELARAADARSRQNADAIRDINDLLALLNDAINNMGGTDIEFPDLSQIDRNQNDIANLREFVILLRRDQVALRDRVAALEASDADQNARLDDLEGRVTSLEATQVTFSGVLALEYNVSRLSGANIAFDVDRLWGLNNERALIPTLFAEEGSSPFSSGDNDFDDDGDTDEGGERAQDLVDIDSTSGNLSPSLTLNFGFGIENMGVGPFNEFEGVITLDLKRAFNLDANAGGTSTFTGYVFNVTNLETFVGIGEFPLTFQFGESPEAIFTPYIMDADYLGVGFVANVGTPDFLAFLQPELTITGGAVTDFELGVRDAAGDDQDASFPNAYYRGIRGTLTPLSEGFFTLTGGFSFAQMSTNAGENANAAGDNQEVTVYGVDGTVGVSIIDISFEYARSTGQVTATYDPDAAVAGDEVNATVGIDASLFYAIADVDTESIPLLDDIQVNYRSIPVDWFGVRGDSDYVFDEDQTGFKVSAGLQLFFVVVDGYFDSYSTAADGNVRSFGVSAGVEVFRAVEVFGFYENTTVNGALVLEVGDAERDNNGYVTGFGFGVRHDGEADNALLPGLTFEVRYTIGNAEFALTSLNVDAEYIFDLGFLTLSPYVAYGSNIRNQVNDTIFNDDTTTLRVGTGLVTEPIDIFLQPSLAAVVNYRNTQHTDVGAGGVQQPDYTANELQFSVGVTLNEFLFNNSLFTARYGYWTGENVSNDYTPPGFADDSATNISEGDTPGTGVQTTSGYELMWQYYGLEFSYGAYLNSNDGVATGGQAFKIRYEVEF